MTVIKRAGVNEFLDIAKLDREVWKDNRNSEFIPDGEHIWRHWVEHALVFAAMDNEEVVGAVCAFPCMSGEFCIHKAFVNKSQRGKGTGSLLFGEILKEIDKLKAQCFLTVDPVNETAIKLYLKWGFTDKEFVKGYYRPNEDRLVLKRRAVSKQ